MVGYLFGDGTGQTQDTLTDARRRMAVAMLQQGMDSSPIRSPWQGAARMAEALVGGLQFRNMQSQQNDTHNQLMSALTGQPYTPPTQSGGFLSSIFGGGNSSAPSDQSGSSGGMTVPAASNATAGNTATGQASVSDPNIFNSFMDTVKSGGLTNPNGLAAVAATGQHESGFSPKNVYGNWADPSQSGRALTAGGALSWNGPRYEAMKQYVAANGGDPTRPDPKLQAQYFLHENPQLIAGLNAAKSPEEAQSLMNNAWRYAGYNQAGGETARRIASARSFLPQFSGQGGNGAPVQTASLDPSAGMGQAYAPPQSPQSNGAAQAINQIAPMGANPTQQQVVDGQLKVSRAMGYEDGQPIIQPQQSQQPAMGNVGIGQVPAGSGGQPVLDVTQVPQLSSAAGLPFANGGSPAGGAPQASAAPMSPQQNLADALMQKNDTALGGIMAPAGMPQPASAQGGGNFPPAPSSQGGQQAVAQAMSGLPPQLASNPKAMALLSVMTNPNASAGDRSVAGMILQQQMTPQYDFITRPDGSVVAVNKLNPAMSQQVQGAMKTDSIVDGPVDQNTGLPSKLVWNPVDGVKGRLGADGSIQPAGQVQAQQAPQPGAIPAPPPGVDPKKYREEAGSRSAADALPSAKDEFGFAKDLTDRPSYKEYAAAVPTWNSFTKHIQDNTPAADKAIVDDFAKILNPGRSVNTGAFLLNMDAQSIPALLQGQLAKAWSGEGELGPDARAQMAQIARLKVEQYRNAWGLDAQQSAEIAKAHHMNSDLIIPKIPDLEDIDFSKINSTTTTRNGLNGGQPAQGSPVQIKSVDDYNNLKSGTEYIDPNGNRRTKN